MSGLEAMGRSKPPDINLQKKVGHCKLSTRGTHSNILYVSGIVGPGKQFVTKKIGDINVYLMLRLPATLASNNPLPFSFCHCRTCPLP